MTKNVLIGNNRASPVTDPDDLVSLLPSGIGFSNAGADRVTVRENIALSNNSAGFAVSQLPPQAVVLDPRIDPFPDNSEVRDNVALHNGDGWLFATNGNFLAFDCD